MEALTVENRPSLSAKLYLGGVRSLHFKLFSLLFFYLKVMWHLVYRVFSEMMCRFNAKHRHGSGCCWHVHSSSLLRHWKVKHYQWDLIGNKPLRKGQRCCACRDVTVHGGACSWLEAGLILHNVNPPFVWKHIKQKRTAKTEHRWVRLKNNEFWGWGGWGEGAEHQTDVIRWGR